jgi:hypothetical protein
MAGCALLRWQFDGDWRPQSGEQFGVNRRRLIVKTLQIDPPQNLVRTLHREQSKIERCLCPRRAIRALRRLLCGIYRSRPRVGRQGSIRPTGSLHQVTHAQPSALIERVSCEYLPQQGN